MRRERKIAVAALLAIAMMFGGCAEGNGTTAGDYTPGPTTEPDAIVDETTAPVEDVTTAPAESETTAPVEDVTTAPAENGVTDPEPTEPEPTEPSVEPTEPEPTEPEPVVSADPWKICGSFTGWGQQDDIVLYVGQEDNVLISAEMELNEEDQFKIRWNDKWDTCYPTSNVTVLFTGTYRISFHTETHEVKLIWCGEGEDPTKDIWTVIGTLNGSNWDKDFRLAESDEENLLVSTAVFALKAGDSFKVRHNCAWEEAYPDSDYKVKQSGNYRIAFNTETKEITFIPAD